ncbi:hypothetical protein [Gymnodinialimonas hymeniacidonis]|uniref:hypothetical protein n=1 Tax=Gymnodinialimonas hymeniacidonis TaxID=3126508 RepID=UPI0034C5CD3D
MTGKVNRRIGGVIALACAVTLPMAPTSISAQAQIRALPDAPLPVAPTLRAPGEPRGTTANPPVFCEDDDWFYWYEEDASGNEIPGTRQYGCADSEPSDTGMG